MIATWGEHQLLPREMIRALGDSGNTPWGAFAGEEMIGYVLGWSGVDPEEGLHTHSHMLATLPDRRHRGVGYRAEAGATRPVPGPGHPAGAMDVRPAALPQRALQPEQARRDRRSVPAQLLRRDDRHVEPWRTERPVDGPVGRRTTEPGGPADGAGFEVLGRAGDDPAAPSPTEVRPPRGLDRADPDPARVSRPAGTRPGPGAARGGRRPRRPSWRASSGLVATGFTADSVYVLTEPA